MVSEKRREMFKDLYRLAEYYEAPPFRPGDIDGNAAWFVEAQAEQLVPFLNKYPGDQLATSLAMCILDDADRQAREMNNVQSNSFDKGE